jgi:hypothetical protein
LIAGDTGYFVKNRKHNTDILVDICTDFGADILVNMHRKLLSYIIKFGVGLWNSYGRAGSEISILFPPSTNWSLEPLVIQRLFGFENNFTAITV